jgi:hypothetical protein
MQLAAVNRSDTADNLESWGRAFIFFHNRRHPGQQVLPELTRFREHIVKTANDGSEARWMRPLERPADKLSRLQLGDAARNLRKNRRRH